MHPVAELVRTISYRPGWSIQVIDDTLYVRGTVIDAYNHQQTVPLTYATALPPAYARIDWLWWLFRELVKVEEHEAAEFFLFNGHRIYDPHSNGLHQQVSYNPWDQIHHIEKVVRSGD